MTEEKIRSALDKLDAGASSFPGMTYEQGIEEALMWVLGDLKDDEFSPAEQ